jgi:hypothetical protein
MTRAFVRDKKNLQREQKAGVPGFLTTLAYLVVLAIVIAILAALTIGLRRMDRDRDASAGDPEAPSGVTGSARFKRQVGARAASTTA